MDRNILLEALTNHECTVTFTKVNGETRVMPCTLKADVIPTPPAEVASKSTVKRHENQNVVSVWCLDKKEWRSFRVDNVVDLQIN
jgi:WYL_2, Sm-like SH3 beta-barrel fold